VLDVDGGHGRILSDERFLKVSDGGDGSLGQMPVPHGGWAPIYGLASRASTALRDRTPKIDVSRIVARR